MWLDWLWKPPTATPANTATPPSTLSISSLLATTAFYFRGTWVDDFDESATVKAPFHAPGGDVMADLMRQTLTTWCVESSSMQIVDLAYRGGCGMIVVLPGTKSSLPIALRHLSGPGELDRLLQTMSPQNVSLALPRLSIDSGTVRLSECLRQLGAGTMFTREADLSGITSMAPAWIDDVTHNATVTIDERGTVATAATGMAAECSPAGRPPAPIEMRVDRPYLMLIRLRRTGQILFASTVTTPSPAH